MEILGKYDSSSGRLTYQATVATGQTGPAVFIPAPVMACSMALIPAGGASGKVQFTLSPVADVNAGTANWQDWPLGVVSTASTDALAFPATAVRAVSASGNVILEVVA